MSWIGRKIYQYLKECEEFKKDMCAGYQPNDRLDTSNPPTNELPNFMFTPLAPKREPFEHFKNNRKKMKKEIRHEETCIIASVENNGVVTITIEPKKGNKVYGVGLDVKTVEITKEPVLPKELLSPKPELQIQYDTLAKLIATRDYYNADHVFNHRDRVYCVCSGSIISINRYDEHTELFFKDGETAQLFQKNFRTEIESVKHLI